MLVLSRREDDRILFPGLGISIHILRIAGNKIRVGVDAPPEVKVLRHELRSHTDKPARSTRLPQQEQSARRRRKAAEPLTELGELCDRDLPRDAERAVLDIFRRLKAIDEGGDGQGAAGAKRALLVEDNVNEAKLLASYLRLKKFDVDVAADGYAALDYLEANHRPDMVLMDMQMPRMDGATAIRRMRADKRQEGLKVYAVSGADPADYGLRVGPDGVDGWFPKPLDPEALVFRIAFDEEGVLAERGAKPGHPQGVA
ncbi:MAG: response regulator [Planctomycetota bacterium]